MKPEEDLKKNSLDRDKSCGKLRRCALLFISMLSISAFTFGGGFVIVTLMKKRFVDELRWLDEQEMLDMTALAQTSPGAIAVNAAILVGWKVAGFAGMISAVLGTVIPPVVILSIISVFYSRFVDNAVISKLLKGMQAGVAAVILDVAAGLFIKLLGNHSIPQLVVFGLSFVAVMFLHINVIFIIIFAGFAGVIAVYAEKLCREKNESRNEGKDKSWSRNEGKDESKNWNESRNRKGDNSL